uniref:Shroom family member 2 n=1 Tax=Takifugu rubripes TaxID=31033 RepID=A0A674PA31_TAKRU
MSVFAQVEEGSVAAAVCLQAGDEMVSVNAVPLSGSRQEAISLVKSSHKKLTLVVRRKNDPVSRPNSWYSAKLTEEELEPAKREATAAPVWPPNNETRPKDSSNRRDQDSHQQLTSQPSSLNNMERLEHPSALYPTGHISPTKYIGSTEPFCGLGGKKDATLSCFSTGSSSPGLEASPIGWKGTSSENIFYKGLQNEGSQAAERPRYLQPTMGNGGWEGEQPSRVSVAVRPHVGPVWQVPENKKDPSPPPPPPLRSDSFAVTKVFPYSEGPIGPTKNKGRSTDKLAENSDRNGFRSYQKTTPESRHSLTPLSANDFLHPSFAADHNQKQLHTNKLFSLSSNDVRHSHHSTLPAHQRQYSDESPRYLQTRTSTPTKIQSVGSYYRSLQDLPKNAFGHKQVRHSTASVSSFTVNPKTENEGHKRYYGIASTPSTQSAELQARPGKAEGWRGKPDKPHWLNNNEPGYQSSFKTNVKSKYSLPQFQMPYSVNKEHNGHSHLGTGLHYDHKSSELSVPSPEDSTKKCEGRPNDVKKHFPAYQSINHSVSLSRHQDPWLPQEDHRISPLKTPLLHSLAQESIILTERQPATTGGKSALENSDIMATGSGKSNRRSDRYATTLRNEIQQKRAQLQKSRSAATLTCDAEEEEAEDTRAPKTSASSGVSFSNTYKDHLKEVQAKVLQATSFQRRDLEPFGPEPLVGKTSNGRIRGRKRFPLAKRTHSFSEPDKIDKVGVEGEPQTGSFGERRKFFENKPAFSRPVLKSSHSANLSTDSAEAIKDKTPTEESKAAAHTSDPSVAHEQAPQEQQRLGTFAEYQATWNKYKKCSDVKSQGRYHSTENILDTDTEETSLCIHERSRSSPSADFYTQNVPSSWEDPPSQQSSGSSGLPYQHDHSSEPAPSAPKNEGPVPIHADHKTKAEEDSPAHATHPSVPRSLSPSAGSQDSLPTPRSHLVPETTSTSLSSSQKKFPSGAQADSASFQPLSSTDTHQQTASRSPVGTAPVGFPQLSMTSGADTGRGAAQGGEETEPPRPLPSPPLSADGARTPSPQFGAQRLTDKPPAAFAQDDSPLRSENDLKLPAEMDVISAVRKVPVMIPHSDSSSEYETQLPQGRESCGGSPLPPCVSSVSATEHPSNSAGPLQSLEDAKREELARDIMGKDRTLVDILDQSGRMTTMDLMEGIFPMEDQLLEGVFQRRRASVGSRPPTSSPRSTDRREEDSMSASAAVVSLVPSSSYYNTSAPKAELLIKMKDMQDQLEEQESEDELDIDLASKKQELIFSLAGKLEVLREARHSLQDDVEDNEALGREVEATVQRLCQPNQLDKFRMFVGDLDKVVSLLLSLSGRLARVENALYSLEEEAPPEEKRTLTEKRKLLMRQHEDAKELKENLDRRERLVAGIMEAHLDAESLDDYRHFVKMKSALIIEQRKLEDKIKLGEEQLKCLLDSLPLEQRPLL